MNLFDSAKALAVKLGLLIPNRDSLLIANNKTGYSVLLKKDSTFVLYYKQGGVVSGHLRDVVKGYFGTLGSEPCCKLLENLAAKQRTSKDSDYGRLEGVMPVVDTLREYGLDFKSNASKKEFVAEVRPNAVEALKVLLYGTYNAASVAKALEQMKAFTVNFNGKYGVSPAPIFVRNEKVGEMWVKEINGMVKIIIKYTKTASSKGLKVVKVR